MSRGIDHLVLCVKDLDAAADVYARLGFTMTPRAQHPFGTGNVLAQLDGCFLEVLGVTRPSDISEADGENFSFAAYNRDFLRCGQGMSMLVLESSDETVDRAEFLEKGLHVYAPFDFQRQAKQPDGSEATVGFSLTFVDDPAIGGLICFTCKQWRPDLFWKPDYQRHANGATSVADVFLVAPEPDKAAAFLAKFADAPVAETASGVHAVETRRGRLSALSPAAFEARFPGAFAHKEGTPPFFAGFALSVPDAPAVGALWRDAGLEVRDGKTGPWLAPDAGLGCVIAAV